MIKKSLIGYPVYVNPEKSLDSGISFLEFIMFAAGSLTLICNLINLI